MMDGNAYKRAIAESPDDHSLLLDYAAWLTSCGDSGGEYLRLEVERRITEVKLLELERELNARSSFSAIDQTWLNDIFPLMIRSPLVGRFYNVLSPELDPYVIVGQRLTIHTVIGCVEVMKIFTEIPAGMSGVVKEILVENGDPVEYGQPIIRVDRMPRLFSGG